MEASHVRPPRDPPDTRPEPPRASEFSGGTPTDTGTSLKAVACRRLFQVRHCRVGLAHTDKPGSQTEYIESVVAQLYA